MTLDIMTQMIARTLRTLSRIIASALVGAFLPAAAQSIDFASDPALLAKAALGDMPGTASVAVWRDGSARHAGVRDGEALDPAQLQGDKALLFEIGSISKVFTGLLLAQAVERGDLSLDDTLGKLLGGGVEFASAKAAGITLRQLVTHTACLPRLPAGFHGSGWREEDPYRNYDRARLWKALAQVRPASDPPCEALYSNFGFAVLGELLSQRYGTTWSELVRARITAPLGMHDTAQALGDRATRLAKGFNGQRETPPWEMQAFAGTGALRSTTADMLVFGRAIAAGRKGPLGAAAERLVTPLARFDGDIGHAIFVRGPANRRTFTHNGGTGGYRSQLVIAGDTGEVAIVFASNADAPVYRVGSELVASRYPVVPGTARVEAERLRDYPGVYRVGDNASYLVTLQNGMLLGRYSGQPYAMLQPSGTDEFTVERRAQVRFIREAGAVQGVQIHGSGTQIDGKRTNEPPPAVATLSDELLQPYVGRYQSPTLSFDVRASNGQLSVKLGSGSRTLVFPVDGTPDRFAYDTFKAELAFERFTTGKVRGLVLHQNGRLRAEKVD